MIPKHSAPLARRLLLAALPLALTACGGGEPERNIATLDEELVNGTDPLLASAVNDPIMTDPDLRQRANADAVRPPSQPYAAPIPGDDVAPAGKVDEAGLMKAPAPTGDCRDCKAAREALTLGALASGQKGKVTPACAASLKYGAQWANRLSADIPLYPAARVSEAAGSTAPGCGLRVVSFTAPQPMQSLLDWYYTRAVKAGYSAEHQADGGEHVLGGARGKDGAAYMLFLRDGPDGGTTVDLVSNRGS